MINEQWWLLLVVSLGVFVVVTIALGLALRQARIKAIQQQGALQAEIQQRNELQIAIAKYQAANEELLKQNNEKQSSLIELQKVKDQHIELQARFQEKESQFEEKQSLLEQSKKALLRDFELAASKLFDAKQESFSKSSRENLENVLQPFRQQLSQFNKQVEDVYHKENTQRNQLIGQIAELQKQAQQISTDANNLAAALKGDNKIQGQWGEVILERILEQSGLEKGREYETQMALKSESGKLFRPDVVIHLPDAKDIVVDSKVALVEYERYVSETEEAKKELHLKGHVDALRTHLKALSVKEYEKLDGLQTLDFVFMFVPIEAAYVSAMQAAPTMFSDAYERNIMIVSPSTLMVALRTVETMWRYEKQNNNAEKIAASAGKLYDQFMMVVESFEDVGSHIQRASDAHDKAFNRMSKGRGNVLKRLDDLKTLGAKASKSLSKKAKRIKEEGEDDLTLLENTSQNVPLEDSETVSSAESDTQISKPKRSLSEKSSQQNVKSHSAKDEKEDIT